jgi:hypothetical protein
VLEDRLVCFCILLLTAQPISFGWPSPEGASRLFAVDYLLPFHVARTKIWPLESLRAASYVTSV